MPFLSDVPVEQAVPAAGHVMYGAYDLVLPIQEVVIKTVRFDFGFIFVGRGVFYLFRKSFPKPGRNKVRI